MNYIPDLHDWTELRKHIAIVKEGFEYQLSDCTGENDEDMVFTQVAGAGGRVFYLHNVVDTFLDSDDRLTLVIREQHFDEYYIIVDNCLFYKFDKPLRIKAIENNLKQHQIT